MSSTSLTVPIDGYGNILDFIRPLQEHAKEGTVGIKKVRELYHFENAILKHISSGNMYFDDGYVTIESFMELTQVIFTHDVSAQIKYLFQVLKNERNCVVGPDDDELDEESFKGFIKDHAL